MRSSEERFNLAMKNANKIKKRRQKNLHNIITSSSVALSIFIIVALANYIPDLVYNSQKLQDTSDLSASIFTNSRTLGFIIVGIISFLLGICVTILCFMLKKREKQSEEAENDN